MAIIIDNTSSFFFLKAVIEVSYIGYRGFIDSNQIGIKHDVCCILPTLSEKTSFQGGIGIFLKSGGIPK